MAVKRLTILGSTGSIGRNTLDVVKSFPGRLQVAALAAHSNVEALAGQIATFNPALVALYEEEAAERLRKLLGGASGGAPRIVSGMEGLIEAACLPEADMVVSAMVGSVGLRPTFAAIEAGKRLAIANKETLVLAGELMVGRARETGSLLLPMDSEHNAIFQCLPEGGLEGVKRIILTASGGPFRDLPLGDFAGITREQALSHPNWKMGPKITIDSATMMNKGLEVMEARWLFGIEPERIKVLIHRQSIIHSMVEFRDGSVLAQLGLPDMRVPIAYCLSHPDRLELPLPSLDLARVGRLDFKEVEPERYPCLSLALEALKRGGGAPAAINGANEAVVAAYLEGAFPFTDIAVILKKVMVRIEQNGQGAPGGGAAYPDTIASVDDALAADRWGRQAAESIIAAL